MPSSFSRKLAPRWVGPFEILQVINNNAVKLRLPTTWRLHPVFNVSLLKPHFGPPLPHQEPAFQVDDEPEYEIEAILRHRIGSRNKLEFLVRWKGYDASEDMWLPEPELGGAQRLLVAYKRKSGLT